MNITVGSEVVKCLESDSKSTKSIGGYAGGIICPDVKDFCLKNEPTNCPNGCSGRGVCNETDFTCACHPGFILPDCLSEFCPNDCSFNG